MNPKNISTVPNLYTVASITYSPSLLNSKCLSTLEYIAYNMALKAYFSYYKTKTVSYGPTGPVSTFALKTYICSFKKEVNSYSSLCIILIVSFTYQTILLKLIPFYTRFRLPSGPSCISLAEVSWISITILCLTKFLYRPCLSRSKFTPPGRMLVVPFVSAYIRKFSW